MVALEGSTVSRPVCGGGPSEERKSLVRSGNDQSGRTARSGPVRWRRPGLLLALSMVAPLALAGCNRTPEEPAPQIRPVRTIVTEQRSTGDSVSLTGHVEAKNEASYGFRIGGRLVERLVNVGDHVAPGQVLARLDPANEQNELRSAHAAVTAAQSQLGLARNDYQRQRQLHDRGFAARAVYERAEQALKAAESGLEDAQARLKLAQDRLDFTELRADAAGTVTARRAEPGEVVGAGQPIVQVARKDGRDAVFDVPAQLLQQTASDPTVIVSLASDPAVTAKGRVREVAPQADPVTRTFAVRVGLIDPPEAMRLGTTVIGRVSLDSGPVIEIPASALTRADGEPAVWVVDPDKKTVSLRRIEVLRFTPSSVEVYGGLQADELVVTAGVQALHPGQEVRLLGTQP